MSCPAPTIALVTLICSLGGCTPEPRDDAPPEGTRRVPVSPVPSQADDAALVGVFDLLRGDGAAARAPAVRADNAPLGATVTRDDGDALARGPALRLDNVALKGESDVLAKLQDTVASLEQATTANAELTARLNAGCQAKAALEAEVAEFRRQVTRLSEDLRAKTDALAKGKAELAAAKATVVSLQPKAEQAEKAAAQIAELGKKLDEALAGNGKLRDQALQAELARVKAQQDLVALQIVVARQKALVKRRPRPTEARAPLRPDAPAEEASQ